ncbi:hypothetical protein CC79DRAFT_909406 [Sarocladium strictum]
MSCSDTMPTWNSSTSEKGTQPSPANTQESNATNLPCQNPEQSFPFPHSSRTNARQLSAVRGQPTRVPPHPFLQFVKHQPQTQFMIACASHGPECGLDTEASLHVFRQYEWAQTGGRWTCSRDRKLERENGGAIRNAGRPCEDRLWWKETTSLGRDFFRL